MIRSIKMNNYGEKILRSVMFVKWKIASRPCRKHFVYSITANGIRKSEILTKYKKIKQWQSPSHPWSAIPYRKKGYFTTVKCLVMINSLPVRHRVEVRTWSYHAPSVNYIWPNSFKKLSHSLQLLQIKK